jgi:hypothetical protein
VGLFKEAKRVRLKLAVLAAAGLALGWLAGCSHNPSGPSGTQTVYNFTVTPATPQGVYAAPCPALVSGKSAVVCTLSRSNTGLNAVLPLDGYAEGGGHTNYYYTLTDGVVNLAWTNDAAYVPQAFGLAVTVVNK